MLPSPRYTIVVISLIVFFQGLITAALGPALPELAAQVGSSLSAIGAIFTAIFLGALLSQFVAGPLSDRLGRRPVLLAGMVLIILGVFGLSSSRALPLALSAACLAGFGYGAVGLTTNVIASQVHPEKSVASLNLVNLFYSLGAFAGPLVFSLVLSFSGRGLPSLQFGARILLVLLLPALRLDLPRAPAGDRPPFGHASGTSGVFRSPLIWALGFFLVVYVGAENGMSGWTTVYMTRSTTIGLQAAALASSGFWLAMTAGRLASAILAARFSSRSILLACVVGALAGGLLMVAGSGSPVPSIASVLLIGLSFGPLYPTVMAVATAAFSITPGTAASTISALGSLGAMLLPWLQGILLDRSGPFTSAVYMAVLGLVLASIYLTIRLKYLAA